MRRVGRRQLLKAGAWGAGGLALSACAEAVPRASRFRHGVASADPGVDRVTLWTRLSDGLGDEVLFVRLARDEALRDVVLEAEVVAAASVDHTVEVAVEGLAAGTTYFYAFDDGVERSPVGRVRTAPGSGPVALGFASCASLAHGWFHGYRRLAERLDLAAVVHLGDYIYEYGDGVYGDRRGYDPPHECLSLDDYRRRYAQYRADPDLQALHASHPLVVTWDDHELANNAWSGGAIEHDPETEGSWNARLEAASRAHREWLPRRSVHERSLYRRLGLGELVDLFVLDTRLEGRDGPPQLPGEEAAPGRTILGALQRERFLAELRASTARWKIVAHAVQLSPQQAAFWNLDAWDGYVAERRAVLEAVADVEGVIFVCGDGHKSFADDLPLDPFAGYDPRTGAGSVAVEVMTPAVTSPNLFGAEARAFEARVRAASPHTRFVDAEQRGYWIVEADEDRVVLSLHFVADIERPDGGVERPGPRFEVRGGERSLRPLESR